MQYDELIALVAERTGLFDGRRGGADTCDPGYTR